MRCKLREVARAGTDAVAQKLGTHGVSCVLTPLRELCLGQRFQLPDALQKLRHIESEAHGEIRRAISPAHSGSPRDEQRIVLVSHLIVRIYLFEFTLFLFKYAADPRTARPIPRLERRLCGIC